MIVALQSYNWKKQKLNIRNERKIGMGKAYLVLEDGEVYEGAYFGYSAPVIGEVVFTTGMTGYLETLTDPSYHGQIIVQTFPLIGNYGVIEADFESQHVGASAYIVKHWCQEPSNFRSEGTLDTFFEKTKVTGLCEIDTRAVTKHIRERGNVNGIITDDPKNVDYEALRNYHSFCPVQNVSTTKIYEEKSSGKYRIAIMDFGIKAGMKNELLNRGCDLIVFPHDTPVERILAEQPDGILLSNGPGDPKENVRALQTIGELLKQKTPMMGICLGHQLLALASGFDTEKMKYGHRGTNQPVKDIWNEKVYISSQNHGYTVKRSNIDKRIASESFINVNDGTCEGIFYKKQPVFSVQFHPEASCGPRDTLFLFDKFLEMAEGGKRDAVQSTD